MPMIARKSVSFSNQVAVYPTLHLDDFTDREVVDTWYSHDEISLIKKECNDTVRMIVDHDPIRPGKYCARGLEFRTPWGSKRRQTNKFRALDAVLDAQDVQMEKHIHDETTLAAIYHQMAAQCEEAAHQLGLHDERYVHALQHVVHKKHCSCKKQSSSSRGSAKKTHPRGPSSNERSRQNVVNVIQNATLKDAKETLTSRSQCPAA